MAGAAAALGDWDDDDDKPMDAWEAGDVDVADLMKHKRKQERIERNRQREERLQQEKQAKEQQARAVKKLRKD